MHICSVYVLQIHIEFVRKNTVTCSTTTVSHYFMQVLPKLLLEENTVFHHMIALRVLTSPRFQAVGIICSEAHSSTLTQMAQ